MSTPHIRKPAVAGKFYPANPERLRAMIQSYLDEAASTGPVPKALIGPHAGYPYSGPVAASAYARLVGTGQAIRKVVLLGPAHWVPVHGLAASSASGFATPLSVVPLDRQTTQELLTLPQVRIQDSAHAPEHSLEVHLPFLQMVLSDFTLTPLVVGDATPEEVAEVLERLWNGPETLIVVSSDLSHYHDYPTAKEIDQVTAQAIETIRSQDIRHGQACGFIPIQGLLTAARHHGLLAQTLDLRNSGDTAGPRDSVVGYGAWAFQP